jgi:hypothetical protein
VYGLAVQRAAANGTEFARQRIPPSRDGQQRAEYRIEYLRACSVFRLRQMQPLGMAVFRQKKLANERHECGRRSGRAMLQTTLQQSWIELILIQGGPLEDEIGGH